MVEVDGSASLGDSFGDPGDAVAAFVRADAYTIVMHNKVVIADIDDASGGVRMTDDIGDNFAEHPAEFLVGERTITVDDGGDAGGFEGLGGGFDFFFDGARPQLGNGVVEFLHGLLGDAHDLGGLLFEAVIGGGCFYAAGGFDNGGE